MGGNGPGGFIDGSGTNGRSWFFGGGLQGVSFTFDGAGLGRLPTHAGIVWTDGYNDIRFEAAHGGGIEVDHLQYGAASSTAVAGDGPGALRLAPCSPSPFSSGTSIVYTLPATGR